MDRSLATPLTRHCETEVQSALAWFVAGSVLISSSAASAESPEPAREDLAKQSGNIMSIELKGRFSLPYLPSGIVPLNDGRFQAVGDKPERELRLISIGVSGGAITVDDESQKESGEGWFVLSRKQLGPWLRDTKNV